jgi:hypothetical protein
MAQILRTATARDRRKFFYRSNHVFTFQIWRLLISLAKKKIIANFHVFGLFLPKKRVQNEKKKFRRSRGVAGIAGIAGVAVVAGGFWMKFEAQLAQPC